MTMASLKVACIVVMCMAVVSAPMTVQAVTCAEVTSNLTSCLSYLTQGGTPSEACCGGVRNILAAAGTTSDKQTVCKCLKDDANNFNINDDIAKALPALCGVNIPYKISRSTDCTAIKF